MKRSTLDLLCCPRCQGDLSLLDDRGDAILQDGAMACHNCKRSFSIEGGIVRFIDAQELEGLNRRFARFYDVFSRVYALFTKMGFIAFGGERKARKEVLDRLDLNGGRILEVSIGSGDNLPYLFESPGVGEVYGLDISAGLLARCNSVVTKRGWSVDLLLGAAEALPFKPGSFDSVLHIGGINFFSDKKRAIDEMIRVARPGSKIVIADESERAAQFIAWISGSSRSHKGKEANTSMPFDLVPDTMEEKRVDGIWKAHGRPHGYCLEFRKPA